MSRDLDHGLDDARFKFRVRREDVDQAAMEWKAPAKYPGYGPPAPLFGGIKGNIQTAYNELKK